MEYLTLEEILIRAKISHQDYMSALSQTKSGKQIILKRKPNERFINQYNPDILRIWRANMDVQFITDVYSCVMYITSYMLKSERSMSELLKKVAEEAKSSEIQ